MKFNGVIFDLDETLVDTSMLKDHRDRRDWATCYRKSAECVVYSGVDEVLQCLVRHKTPVGIVTNSPRKYAQMLLAAHKIPFDALVAYHDCDKHKPDADPMLLCADNLRLDAKRVISVGDDQKDILAGKAAGMVTVGVTWGTNSYDQLTEVHPDYICHTPNDLLILLTES